MTRDIPLREQIVAAAGELTSTSGWASVTMSRLAAEVGVSRQTIHTEVGTKSALAEALVVRELERFLVVVEDALDTHSGDIESAIAAATLGVLELAQDNAVLKAVVSATHGADTELLPLLTTHSDSLLAMAKGVVGAKAATFDLPLTSKQLDVGVDVIVRVVLSHAMQPSAAPEQTAEDLAWAASRVLGR